MMKSFLNFSKKPTSQVNRKGRKLGYNIFVWLLLGLYLMPVAYMVVLALMPTEQLSAKNAPLYPAQFQRYTYEGKEYQLYKVPTEAGLQQLALVAPAPRLSYFVDPLHPEKGLLPWEGNWHTLEGVYEFHPTWENLTRLFRVLPFATMLRNTFILTVVGEIAVLISSILAAYGFARFPLPGGDLLFYILIATFLIPDKVTFIPTYFFNVNVLHWRGTIYPLLVPLFFGNAVYIFLLRQNFKSIPRELEEAAMLDGAGSLRRLFSVVLPQSWPVIVTVSLLHFFYTWNETRLASVYLNSTPEWMPVSFAVQNFQSRVPIQNVIEAATLVVMVIPVLVLLLGQRFFLQGLVITGAEKRG